MTCRGNDPACPCRDGDACHYADQPDSPALPIPPLAPYQIGADVWPGLSKLIEEMGELGQVLGKIMGTGGSLDHWAGDLRQPLLDELADVAAAMSFFVELNLTPTERAAVRRRTRQKFELFSQWQREQRAD